MVNTPDRVMIVSDSQALADTLEHLLKDTFHHLRVFVHFNLELVAKRFRQSQSDVLVLAYQDLEIAITVREAITQARLEDDKPFHFIVLCKKETVSRAYELSKQRLFYDYVVFWPLGYDPYRLIMSVHQAIDDLGYNADIQQQRLELESRRQRVQAVSRMVEQLLTDQQSRKSDLEESIRVALKKLTLTTKLQVQDAQDRPTQVLVVDDDEFQCVLLKKMLEESGFVVYKASDGHNALEQLEKLRPDFILLDVVMPNMGGIEVLKQLKNDPELADIPVIMVSGHHEKDIVLDCIMLGALNYVVKPINKEVLLSHLPKRS